MSTSPLPVPDRDEPLRLREPGDVLSALPYLLGYRPERSLVLICLRRRGRLGMVARVDLPPARVAAREVNALAEMMAGHAARDGAERAVVVIYGTRDWQTGHTVPYRRVVKALEAHLDRAGIAVVEQLYAGRSAYRSYLCCSEACCPFPGVPLTELDSRPVAAEMVLSGRGVRPRRDDALAEVALVGAEELQAVSRHAAEWLSQATGPEWVSRSASAFGEEVQRLVDGPGNSQLHPQAAGRILGALSSLPVRDEVCVQWCWDRTEASTSTAVRELLAALAARAGEGIDTQSRVAALTLLAVACWRDGDGASSRLFCEAALELEATYRLAVLQQEVLDCGLPPAWAMAARE